MKLERKGSKLKMYFYTAQNTMQNLLLSDGVKEKCKHSFKRNSAN